MVVAFGVVIFACPAATTPPSGFATAVPICKPNNNPAGKEVRINDVTVFNRAEQSLRCSIDLLTRCPTFLF